MKTFTTILKVLAVLLAVAGVVYVVATYGDKIVAWAKKLLRVCPCKNDCDECECDGDCCDCECDVCACTDSVMGESVVAGDSDFEG